MILLVVLLGACAPSEEAVKLQVGTALAEIPTQTAYPTLTPYPSFTALPTQIPYLSLTSLPTYTPRPPYPRSEPEIVIVTPTVSLTPLYTPTVTDIPTETELPTPTLDPLYSPLNPGIYLVCVDIGPGIWRSDTSLLSKDCYWEITDKTGEILKNHFGMADGTMYILPNAFQVEMHEGCGVWTFLGDKQRII